MMPEVKLFALCLVIIVVLSVCNGVKPDETRQSVDLSQISLDGIQIGNPVSKIDRDKYTSSDRFRLKANTINFEEWRITYDKNQVICGIHANFSSINISVNSNTDLVSIDDVLGILGEDSERDWYDREQGLKHITYYDVNNALQAVFVYSDYNGDLVWVIIE